MISISNDYQKNPSIPAPNQPDIISDAPSDILTFIASLLPMNNIVQFSLVSKKFYQITKNETLWKLFINKLQITWNEKVGARQELIALKKTMPGLHTHVAGLLGPTAFSKLPTLNLQYVLKYTSDVFPLKVDFFFTEQVTSPIMKGVDLGNHPFIAIRYINRKATQPAELKATVVFHKYMNQNITNDVWATGAPINVHNCLEGGTMRPAVVEYMDRLITGKPCGENPSFEQCGDSKTMRRDGKSVVELA